MAEASFAFKDGQQIVANDEEQQIAATDLSSFIKTTSDFNLEVTSNSGAIVFEKEDLSSQKFIGSLNKNYSIVNILEAMQNTSIINSFEIRNKSIIIK